MPPPFSLLTSIVCIGPGGNIQAAARFCGSFSKVLPRRGVFAAGARRVFHNRRPKWLKKKSRPPGGNTPKSSSLSFCKAKFALNVRQTCKAPAEPDPHWLRRLPMGRLRISVMPSAMATATFTVSMPFCTIMPLYPKMK